MSRKKIIKHATIALVSLIILIGSLFISRPVDFPSREVRLGYPIHFYTMDFGNNQSELSGAPDQFLKEHKFSIWSSWEERGSGSWVKSISSYLIIFLVLEGVIFSLSKIVSGKGKKLK